MKSSKKISILKILQRKKKQQSKEWGWNLIGEKLMEGEIKKRYNSKNYLRL
jgi:hypothetical protein